MIVQLRRTLLLFTSQPIMTVNLSSMNSCKDFTAMPRKNLKYFTVPIRHFLNQSLTMARKAPDLMKGSKLDFSAIKVSMIVSVLSCFIYKWNFVCFSLEIFITRFDR